jgi:ubiquinone/menaquinone biosynthesis C-methylase UbiE
MDHKEQQPDWQEMARQLSCPDGENGIKTGNMMNQTNGNMTATAIRKLKLQDGETVLEIGPGNGSHITALLNQAGNLHYTGLDISATMLAEAARINAAYVAEGSVTLLQADGEHIDTADNSFDKIFTVNTLYFWKDPAAYLAEIIRVMKSGAALVLTFATRDFMENLPFVQYGFTLYTREEVEQLLTAGGLHIDGVFEEKEQVTSNTGDMVDRNFVVIRARKA